MSYNVSKLIKTAEKLVSSNNLEAAANAYKKLCKLDQHNPSVWMAFGSVSANLKQYKDAESAFRKANNLQNGSGQAAEYLAQILDIQGETGNAIKILEDAYKKTSNISFALKVGILYARCGDFIQSINWLKKYTNKNNNNSFVHHCLASAFESLEDHQSASYHYQNAISLDPASYQILGNYGAFLQKIGDFKGALDVYLKSSNINNQYPITHYNLGSLYHALGEYSSAISYYTRAIQLNPEYIEAYVGLGRSYRSSGEAAEAIKCYDIAINLDSNCVEAYSNKARALLTHARYDEALESYKTALSLDPDNEEIKCSIAAFLERKGEYDTARSMINALIEHNPYNKYVSIAYGAISRKFDERDRAINNMKTALLDPKLSPTDRSDIHYVLGKLYDDLSDFDNAFENFKSANDLLPFKLDYDALSNSVNKLKSVFSAEKLKAYSKNTNPSDKPIFIVGMPRSGTTLVEQIIASHPNVYGAGELPYISDLARNLFIRLGSDVHFPDNVRIITPDIAERMANEYIQLATIYNPDCIKVTDKMPHNFRLLGLIELLFPNAKIVHCTRNPIDTCLSIYVNSFVSTHPYATDLKNIGVYYTDYYQQIMSHWKSASSLDIKEISYEKLIDNQEEMSRELIMFCGLDWNDNCLSFHKTRRNVATLSYDQVRQPIYKKSRERWRNYEKHLQPLLDHFGIDAGR
jgi:tetratricopeptide (TPR) repeat protein